MSEDLERACASCGEPLQPGQDWCLQCGAGAEGRRGGPGWRSAVAALGGAAVLALGAAAAAYAALNQSSPASPAAPTPAETVAQTPPPVTSTSTTSTAAIPPPPPSTGEELALPHGGAKPPGIPSVAPMPEGGQAGESEGGHGGGEEGGSAEEGGGKGKGGKSSGNHETGEGQETTCTTSTGEEEATEEAAGGQTEASEAEELEAKELEEEGGCPGSEAGKGVKAAPIVLHKHAASTYDPNAYPEADFAGPQLAIDGVTTTSWTAAASAELAPKVDAGLLIDLSGKREIAKVGMISATLGMTVQVYGTSLRKAPKSIEAAGWKKLSKVHLVQERNSAITLKRRPEIRQLLIWVMKAPEVEAEAEGEEVADTAAINELALYEPK